MGDAVGCKSRNADYWNFFLERRAVGEMNYSAGTPRHISIRCVTIGIGDHMVRET